MMKSNRKFMAIIDMKNMKNHLEKDFVLRNMILNVNKFKKVRKVATNQKSIKFE